VDERACCGTDRANAGGTGLSGARSSGAMALQSDRGYQAAPQMLVRLTGSHLAKPASAQWVAMPGGITG
jgi:hypothetical protein